LYVSNNDNVVSVIGIENGVAPPLPLSGASSGNSSQQQLLANKPFLEMIVNTLQCSENDYSALFALCLLYALGHNSGTVEERYKLCSLFCQEL
jgi:protein CLEC16A